MPIVKDDIAFLESMDTPTVCNVIEIVAPERRGHGYTTRHLHCAFPDLPPKVGFAKTVTMRAKDPVPLGDQGYYANASRLSRLRRLPAQSKLDGDPGS